MSTGNILTAIEEKRKWERRLDAVGSELSALASRRREILQELDEIKEERGKLLDELRVSYDADIAPVTRAGLDAMNPAQR